jgi:hypothetical protein
MIYKLESVHVVISKVVRDLGLGDKEINWQDMIEWLAEGLKDIGAYQQFTHKQEVLEVEDFKAELPCDFHAMVRIMDCDLINNRYLIGDSSTTINSTTSYGSNDYKINHNIITVGFQTGTVTIQYLAFPIDENNLPLVPDNDEFRRALFWKIAYQLGIQGYTFKNPMLNNLQYTGMKWGNAKLSARAEGNMPDPMMYERLKNGYMRLVTTTNDFENKFIKTNLPENLNLNGNY